MKKLILIFALLNTVAALAIKDGYGAPSPSWASPSETPLSQMNKKIQLYGENLQDAGKLYAASFAMKAIADAADNLKMESLSYLGWVYTYKSRSQAAISLMKKLNGSMREQSDPSIKLLVDSTLTSIEGLDTTLQAGDFSYWSNLIDNLSTRCREAARTLNTTGDLVVANANKDRSEAVALLKGFLEKPENLPKALQENYNQQLADLKKIDADYFKKQSVLEQSYKELQAGLEAELNLRRENLNRQLADQQATLQKEHTTAHETLIAELKAKEEKAKALYEINSKELTQNFEKWKKKETEELESRREQLKTLEQNITTLREQTQSYLNQAQTAQQNLETMQLRVKTLISQLVPPVGGQLTVTHNTSMDTAMQSLFTRVIKSTREYSDPAIWDRLQPSFTIVATADFADDLKSKNKNLAARVKFKMEMRVGLQTFVIPPQEIIIGCERETFKDVTSSLEVKSLASVLAPEIMKVLQNPNADEWISLARQAVTTCEEQLKKLTDSLPANPVANESAYPPGTGQPVVPKLEPNPSNDPRAGRGVRMRSRG